VPKRRDNLCQCKPAQLQVAHKTGVRLHICMETFSWKWVSDKSDDLAEGGFGIEQRAMQNITDTQQTTAKAGTQYWRFTQHKKTQLFVVFFSCYVYAMMIISGSVIQEFMFIIWGTSTIKVLTENKVTSFNLHM